ncbi:YqxA family protein [Robertmurraya sp.]|uniref:YqxA family protein n=1 Tax=Robertmurraya sp. TaxID=2837525 RepID=UPI003703CA5B
MKMFMFKSILLMSLMFVSVLFGMQIANNGIVNMKGFEDPNFKGAFTINEQEENVQVSVLGNNVDSHDINKKREQLEEMEAYNFFSDLGKTLADIVTGIVDITIDLIRNS